MCDSKTKITTVAQTAPCNSCLSPLLPFPQGTRCYWAPEMLVKDRREALEREVQRLSLCEQQSHMLPPGSPALDDIQKQRAFIDQEFKKVVAVERADRFWEYDGTMVSRQHVLCCDKRGESCRAVSCCAVPGSCSGWAACLSGAFCQHA